MKFDVYPEIHVEIQRPILAKKILRKYKVGRFAISSFQKYYHKIIIIKYCGIGIKKIFLKQNGLLKNRPLQLTIIVT